MIAGWCPVRAFRCRRRRGLTDWLLLAFTLAFIGLGLWSAIVTFLCR